MNANKAKQRMDSFEPKSSRCPVCKKDFRRGCEHSIKQAKDRLFEDYVKALAREANN